MKKTFQHITSLVLIFALTVPSSLFAQAQQVELSDSLKAYTDRPLEVNVADAKKITSPEFLENGTYVRLLKTFGSSLAAGGLALFVFKKFHPDSVNTRGHHFFSLSEFEIVKDPAKLEEFIKRRLHVLKHYRTAAKDKSPMIASVETKNYQVITDKFHDLDSFLSSLENKLGFSLADRFSNIVDSPDLLFYNSFSRFGQNVTKHEALLIIQCLTNAEHPELLLDEKYYKNLVKALHTFGYETTHELAWRYHSDVFLDATYIEVEKKLLQYKTSYPKQFPAESVELAGYQLELEKSHNANHFLQDINNNHRRVLHSRWYKYQWRSTAAIVGAAVVIGGIVLWVTSPSKEHPTSVLDDLNMSEQDLLLMAETDREEFINILKSSPILAATFAWIYHVIMEAKKDLDSFEAMKANEGN